jgi:hypothetical protein
MGTETEAVIARAHHALVQRLVRGGPAPRAIDVAADLGVTDDDARAALRRLEEVHGVVLHPDGEPWVVHPFSLSPTATWVEAGADGGWWAPCTWCALGICALVGGRAIVRTRIGGEREEVEIAVDDGDTRADLLVHFAIPPRRAWVNVHHHCAMVLPFRDAAAVDRWSARHGLPRGEVVPIGTVAALSRSWYGRHADPDWRKWTTAEAGALFRSVGLTSAFWALDGGVERF